MRSNSGELGDFVLRHTEIHKLVLYRQSVGKPISNFIESTASDQLSALRKQTHDVFGADMHMNYERASVLKYAICHLKLAIAYGEQLRIASDDFIFCRRALHYLAIALAEIDVLQTLS
jgi:hypothetical protein